MLAHEERVVRAVERGRLVYLLRLGRSPGVRRRRRREPRGRPGRGAVGVRNEVSVSEACEACGVCVPGWRVSVLVWEPTLEAMLVCECE